MKYKTADTIQEIRKMKLIIIALCFFVAFVPISFADKLEENVIPHHHHHHRHTIAKALVVTKDNSKPELVTMVPIKPDELQEFPIFNNITMVKDTLPTDDEAVVQDVTTKSSKRKNRDLNDMFGVRRPAVSKPIWLGCDKAVPVCEVIHYVAPSVYEKYTRSKTTRFNKKKSHLHSQKHPLKPKTNETLTESISRENEAKYLRHGNKGKKAPARKYQDDYEDDYDMYDELDEDISMPQKYQANREGYHRSQKHYETLKNHHERNRGRHGRKYYNRNRDEGEEENPQEEEVDNDYK